MSTYYELRERQIDIPLTNAALILIDTWATENQRVLSRSVGQRGLGQAIAPLLAIARELDIVVLHAPHRRIGWDGVNVAPGTDLRGPADTPRSEVPEWVKGRIEEPRWPPVEFMFRVGEYSMYSRYTNPSYIPYTAVLGIHEDLTPRRRAREFIESSPRRVQEIFRAHRILHLFYVGAATNQCVVQRPVGVRRMSSLGYNTIIVRGATRGTEFGGTHESADMTEAAIRDIEINNGFSVAKEDLLKVLESVKAGAP